MLVAAPLAALIGLSLGLLGGGGSILAVPVLIYALGLATAPAIAASLLVVGLASVVALVPHALQGNVRWRPGLAFGAVSIAGAAAGGLVSPYIPPWILLVGLALLMALTAVLMLRRREDAASASGRFSWPRVIRDGLVVGLLAGLLGAGGGFLIVPALALSGRLPVRHAIGTSLLVIAMNSLVGFAAHATHTPVEWTLALTVAAIAAVGSLAGAALVRRVSPQRLRRGFAWFVLAMAGFVLYQQLPTGVLEAIFVRRWPFWAGGIAIGSFVLLLLWRSGRLLGISTGYVDACSAAVDPAARRSWRLPLLAGVVGGGLIAALAAGGPGWTLSAGAFESLVASSPSLRVLLFVGGGVLIGFGARLAGGCTSGHGIVGVAQLAPSSLLATAGFMAAGFLVTNLLLRVGGGLA